MDRKAGLSFLQQIIVIQVVIGIVFISCNYRNCSDHSDNSNRNDNSNTCNASNYGNNSKTRNNSNNDINDSDVCPRP